MVRQYQVTVNPDKLRAFDIPLSHIQNAIVRGNQEIGASVVEMAEAEIWCAPAVTCRVWMTWRHPARGQQ